MNRIWTRSDRVLDILCWAIVTLAALSENIRLLRRLPYGLCYSLVFVQMAAMVAFLLRAVYFPIFRPGMDTREERMRPWLDFYWVVLFCLLIDSLWNLCLEF